MSPSARRITPARAPGSRDRPGTERRLAALLQAALEEFATRGFEGAGLRSIARRAGMESGHLTYYAKSKDELWRMVVERFADGLVQAAAAVEGVDIDKVGVAGAKALLRPLLGQFAENPLLTRLVLHEFSLASARNRWLARRFARPVWQRLQPLFRSLQRRKLVAGSDPWVAYFGLVGAAILHFGSLPEIATIRGARRQAAGASQAMIDWLLDRLFSTR